MKLRALISGLLHPFNPKPKVGGLEISHAGARLFMLRGDNAAAKVAIPFLPGTLRKGVVENKAQFVSALTQLHEKISALNTPINVVVSVPSQIVYTQSFAVPALEKEKLEEAIDLNLQMISPSPIVDTFYDWQELKEGSDARHLDLLGAFAPAKNIREYLNGIEEAGFNVVSVEFPALSLARLIKDRWEKLEANKHYLVMYLNNEGILLSILKNGNLAFSQFTPWEEALTETNEKGITFEQIRSFLTQTIQQILNYYFGRSSQTLTEAILISPFFNFEIVDLAQKTFNLNIKNLSVGDELTEHWFVAFGSALRGLTARSHDTAISLTETNTQSEYYRERAFAFISIWRVIIVSALTLLLIATISLDTIFFYEEQRLKNQSIAQLAESGQGEINALKQEANRFNQLLAFVDQAAVREIALSPILVELKELSGSGITFDRLVVNRGSQSVVISGQATNELAAINFKNRLAKQPTIASVSLPLSNIKALSDGSVSFIITLSLTPLE